MKIALYTVLALLSACAPADSTVFTLYRNSVLNPQLRVHVATFDARDSEQYNNDNCNHAAELFSTQPGLGVRFWCEKGRFRL